MLEKRQEHAIEVVLNYFVETPITTCLVTLLSVVYLH